MTSTSFLCPTCRRDVREVGLARPRPRTFVGPFWNVVLLTAGLCFVALFVALFGDRALSRIVIVSGTETTWVAGEPYRALDVSVSGWRPSALPGPRTLVGELTADLYLQNGEVVTLEVF